MNELLIKKYENQIRKQGVPQLIAKEIVMTAIEASKGGDIQTYIDYALKLVYGMDFLEKRKSI